MLAEEIKHHIKEEEKPGEGIFAQARKAEMDMDELGARLAARKEELLAEYEQGPPTPKTRSFTGYNREQSQPVAAS